MKPIDPSYRYSNFLHPKYWPTWLVVAVLYLISLLPYNFQQKLGEWIGKLFYRLGGTRRKIVEKNIAACFLELSPEEQRKLVLDSLIANAKGYIECTVGWWRPMDRFHQSLQVHGLEHLREAERRGKGILLLGGHFSILDFAGPLISRVLEFNYMYRPHNNPLFNAVIERSRQRFMNRSFTKKQLHDMIAFIKQGNLVWYGFDQDFGRRNTVFAPFFGVPAATLTTPAWIARRTGATVLMVSQFREGNGVYSLYFSPIFENYPTDDEIENATRINAQLEAEIRRDPDQYLWLHRRFKTRPPGEPNFYR